MKNRIQSFATFGLNVVFSNFIEAATKASEPHEDVHKSDYWNKMAKKAAKELLDATEAEKKYAFNKLLRAENNFDMNAGTSDEKKCAHIALKAKIASEELNSLYDKALMYYNNANKDIFKVN